MCFNTPVSFFTFLVELLISLYLYNRNKNYDRMNAIFIISFALIQLWEGGIWDNPQSSFVAVILLTLWLQPLAQTYGAYYVTKSQFLLPFIVLYILTFIYAIYRVINGNFSVNTGENCHLIWNDSNKKSFVGPSILPYIYILGLLLPLIYTRQWILLFIGLGTLIYSIYNYGSTGEMSSFWCYSAVIYSIAAIFV